MKMKTYVYFVRGQGGAATSAGVDQMAAEVTKWKDAHVKTFDWASWQEIVTDVNAHASEAAVRLACGYSLGANAMTWALGGVSSQGKHALGIQHCVFDFCAFIDPTSLSVITPLSQNTLKQALHFKSHSLDFVGHATLPLAGFIPSKMKVVDTILPHLMLDWDPSIQKQILDTFKEKIAA
jgi:hypothetical protein